MRAPSCKSMRYSTCSPEPIDVVTDVVTDVLTDVVTDVLTDVVTDGGQIDEIFDLLA